MKQTWFLTTLCSAVLVLGLSGAVAFAVDNVDPDDDGSQFGWGENVGWANAEPGGDGGPGVFVENDALSGYIWAENVGWINLSCLTNASCGIVDYGVSNDEESGNLDGFGWGENIGWVNFNPATGGGVTIDPCILVPSCPRTLAGIQLFHPRAGTERWIPATHCGDDGGNTAGMTDGKRRG